MRNQHSHEKSVVIFVRGYPPAFLVGGPIRTVEALVEQTPPDFKLTVVTSDRDLGMKTRLDVPRNIPLRRGNADVLFASTDSLRLYFAALKYVRQVRPRVVYLNSFFDLKFSVFPLLAAKLGFFGDTVILLAPRGELHPGALAIKRGLKRIFVLVMKMLLLHRNINWHGSTPIEQAEIVDVFPKARKVIVKEDETSLPLLADEPLLSQSAGLKMVFLSRISPKKGLDILLSALAFYPESAPAVSLDIIGSAEEDEYLAVCKALIEKVPANVTVRMLGSLPHEQIRRQLAEHDFMLLPTHGENFGHVVAEALSVSVPVAITDTTPWTPHIKGGGGILVTENTADAWANTVEELARKSAGQLFEYRESAQAAYNRWMAEKDRGSLFDKLTSSVWTRSTRN